jgi:hypothetical protein
MHRVSILSRLECGVLYPIVLIAHAVVEENQSTLAIPVNLTGPVILVAVCRRHVYRFLSMLMLILNIGHFADSDYPVRMY